MMRYMFLISRCRLLISNTNGGEGHGGGVIAQVQFFEFIVSPLLFTTSLPNLSTTFATPAAEEDWQNGEDGIRREKLDEVHHLIGKRRSKIDTCIFTSHATRVNK